MMHRHMIYRLILTNSLTLMVGDGSPSHNAVILNMMWKALAHAMMEHVEKLFDHLLGMVQLRLI